MIQLNNKDFSGASIRESSRKEIRGPVVSLLEKFKQMTQFGSLLSKWYQSTHYTGKRLTVKKDFIQDDCNTVVRRELSLTSSPQK